MRYSTVSVIFTFCDGESAHYSEQINEVEKAHLRQRTSKAVRARDALVADLLVQRGKISSDDLASWSKVVKQWEMQFPDEDHNWRFRDRVRGRRSKDESESTIDRRVGRCCRALRTANRLLPSEVRDDELDEWVDEIEAAADEGLPILRRTLSILFRALPSLTWRSRLPARARRGEG